LDVPGSHGVLFLAPVLLAEPSGFLGCVFLFPNDDTVTFKVGFLCSQGLFEQ
jgi:hypothetical protein